MQNDIHRKSLHFKGNDVDNQRHDNNKRELNFDNDVDGYVVLESEHRHESLHISTTTTSFPLCFKNLNDMLSSFHSLSGRVVLDPMFQKIIVALILVNSMTMGLATFPVIRDNPTRTLYFERLDRIFLCIFTAELGLEFAWNGLALFQCGWLTFDTAVIVLSWAFLQAQVIRAFRVIRALRVITRVQELKDLVEALLSVIPSLAAIGALLLLVFYIFAVMFTQLFHDLYSQGYTDLDYFSRLDITFFTLFQLLLLDGWSDITRQCMHRYPWAWVIFISFTIISAFVVVNLIIAVICNAVPPNTTIGTGIDDKKPSDGESQTSEEIEKLRSRIDEMHAILKSLQQQSNNQPQSTQA